MSLTDRPKAYGQIMSSEGSRWSGLPIWLIRTSPCERFSMDIAESLAGCVLANAEVSWYARGVHHKDRWRPQTTVFLKRGFQLDDFITTGHDIGVVELQDRKISELLQDDVCKARADFLEIAMGTDEQLAGMVRAMIAEAEAGNPAGDLFAQSISVALLAHLHDRYDRSRAAKRLAGRLTRSQVTIIRRYVNENIDQDLSLVELSNLLQLSPSHFCRAFSKTVGVSPHRYVVAERIAIAKSRLRQASPPACSELAKVLGFSNKAHFSSAFRMLVGCSPTEFARRQR